MNAPRDGDHRVESLFPVASDVCQYDLLSLGFAGLDFKRWVQEGLVGDGFFHVLQPRPRGTERHSPVDLAPRGDERKRMTNPGESAAVSGPAGRRKRSHFGHLAVIHAGQHIGQILLD